MNPSPLLSNCVSLRRFPMCILALMLLSAGCLAQTPKIEITQPKDPSKPSSVQESLRISFKVTNASSQRIRVRVDGDQDVVTSNEIRLTSTGEHVISVNLFKGANHITLIGFVNDVPTTTLAPRIEAICDTRWCKDYFSLKPENVASEYKETPTVAPEQSSQPITGKNDDSKSAIHIETPDPKFANHYQNGNVKFKIKVDANDDVSKSVKALYVRVLNRQKPVDQTTKKDLEVKFANGSKSAELTPTVTLAEGANEVTVFDPENFETQRATITVWCDACESVGEATPSTTSSQEGSVKISGPKSIQADQKEAKITVVAGKKGDNAEKSIKIEVTNNDQSVPQAEAQTVAADKLGQPVEFTVKLWKGLNKVTAFEVGKKDTDHDSAEITCKENCGTKDPVLITIDSPAPDATFPSSFYTASLTVEKASANQIDKLKYYVLHDKTQVVDPRDVEAVDVKYDAKGLAKVIIPIKFVAGKNEVFFFDPDHDDARHKASVIVNCDGANCATDFVIAQYPTNSMTTRAVVGMEQAGASSASSETKPFLDFFFTGGLVFDNLKDKDGCVVLGPDRRPVKVPRFGTWGQIRLSTTPQQTASAAVFPSNFVNQITDPTKIVDLVQSFDFLAGTELRVLSANGWNWTLIPGIKQKSRLFFTFGAGAISPLTASRTAAQIFKIPSAGDATTPPGAQRANFIARFGEPPAGKTYVGFVPLERDRFFRQYYFGIRIKTHYCEDDDCNRFKNRFPSIVDFAFGQNEAVTGGRFHQDDGKRAWVMRLDAFYPLPIKDASFLYLYGTVLMKAFGAKGSPGDLPLFLDTAPGEVQITDNSVFVPTALQQPSRANRDYYKIGIGVNLTDLFNRNKTPQH